MICSTQEPMALVVRNWNTTHETPGGRRRKGPSSWVALPTRHDGVRYRRLMQLPRGAEIFGAWCLLISVAARCPRRGILVDEYDQPLTAQDLSDMTGFPAELFELAIEALLSERIGWLQRVPMTTIHEWNAKTAEEEHLAKLAKDTAKNQKKPPAAANPNAPASRNAASSNDNSPSHTPDKPNEHPLVANATRLVAVEEKLRKMQILKRIPNQLLQPGHITTDLIQKLLDQATRSPHADDPLDEFIKLLGKAQ